MTKEEYESLDKFAGLPVFVDPDGAEISYIQNLGSKFASVQSAPTIDEAITFLADPKKEPLGAIIHREGSNESYHAHFGVLRN
jgi:hypothetical protein